MIPPHTAPPCPPDWGLASFATNSPQTGFPCPLSTIVFFSPRYIGATQDLLRTSLLFRIHYPYTVHTVQCTYCTYSLISNTFSIQNQHCESRKKLWQRDKWQLVGCTTNILLIFFVCLLYTVKKYSNGTGSWATWAATLLGTVQVLTGAPWAGRSSPAI